MRRGGAAGTGSAQESGDERYGEEVTHSIQSARSTRRRHNREVTTPSDAPELAPAWIAKLYIVLAVLLIPWIVYLGLALPERTTSSHWDIAWVGFDAMEFAALAFTGWLAYRRSTWVEVAATASAVMLLVDAWFDITTANGGWEMTQAVLL